MKSDVPGYSAFRELSDASGRVVRAVRDGSGEMAIKYLAEGEWVRDEIRTLATVRDPHVVGVLEGVEGERGAAIVMELVEAVSLESLLGRSRLTPEAALHVLKQAVSGLGAIHGRGLAHGDLRPGNVLVGRDGDVKVTGFAIAGHGAPRYMAPEQWRGEATPASDLYAATTVFYHCVTGHAPFQMDDLEHVHREIPVPLSWLPEGLQGLAARGMAKNPLARPRTADMFVALLEAVAQAVYGDEWERRGAAALVTELRTAEFPSAEAGAELPVLASEVTQPVPATPAVQPASRGLRTPVLVGAAAAVVVLAGGAVLVVVQAKGDGGGAQAQVQVPPSVSSANPSGGVSRGRVTYAVNPTAVVIGQAARPTGWRQWREVRVTVSPAKVAPGGKVAVRVVDRQVDRSGCPPVVRGSWTWSVGQQDGAGFLWLYPGTAGSLPGRRSDLRIDAKVRRSAPKSTVQGCKKATVVSSTYSFTVPTRIGKGTYLLSPFNPPRVVRLRKGPADVPLAQARATNAGRLPTLTVG